MIRVFQNKNNLTIELLRLRFPTSEQIDLRHTATDDESLVSHVLIVSSLTDAEIETILATLISPAETNAITRRQNARIIAKAIPNWATWTQADWQTYFDANLSDAQADLVTSFAAARVMIKRQNLVIEKLVKLVFAMRDETWPDLPEL